MKEPSKQVKKMEITFSIPAYNDECTLENLVNECIDFANQYNFNYRFLLIDDGSTDNTKFVIKKLENKYDFISAIYHPENLSFGPTLKEVFTLPKTEWICFLPGDHQFSAFDFLNPSLEFTNEYDFILGKRVKRADNIYRLIISKFYNFCISIISNTKVNDVNSSVLFKRKIVDSVIFKGRSAFVHAELYLNTYYQGFKIIEVPINHREREYGKAGGSKLKVLFATIRDMISFAINKQDRKSKIDSAC